MTRPDEGALDAKNAEFWNELCGTALARHVGATSRTPEDLQRFDAAFLDFYPYLRSYLQSGGFGGARVLEIGLGYGTLGQLLLEGGASYTGVDIADGPVEMMRYRIALAGREGMCGAQRGSALGLPFDDGTFDFVYSIGCLHHIGDLARGISEVSRVLRPGGRAVVMVYNRWSWRRLKRMPRRALSHALERRADHAAAERARYDSNEAGEANPHTDFVSARDLRRLFSGFSSVKVDRRNMDMTPFFDLRRCLLAMRIDRLVGLDLYARATR